jgi:hypothetical protein
MSQAKIAIYGPMNNSVPDVMFLIRENSLRGQMGGGWALEIEFSLLSIDFQFCMASRVLVYEF